MQLFLKEFNKKCYIIIILLSLLLAGLIFEQCNHISDFFYLIECTYPAVPLVFCCLILANNDQNELFLSYKVRLHRLFFTEFFSYYLAMAFPLIIFYTGIYPYVLDKPTGIFIPYLISCLITSLFLMSATVLFRLAVRNAYASIGFIFLTTFAFSGKHHNLAFHTMPDNESRIFIYIDPYLSQLTVCSSVWYANRLLLLAVSFVFLTVSFILLKKEIINKN